MKKLLMLFTIGFALLLSGCWSARELPEIGIIMAMAIDKVEDEYEVTVEAMVPSSAAGQSLDLRSPSMIFSSTSSNICSAFRKLSFTMSRFPTTTHVSEVLIGESVAKDGMTVPLGCLLRDNEFRYSTRLYIVKDTPAKDVLKMASTMETTIASKVYKITDLSEQIYSMVHGVNVINFVNCLISEGTEATLPGLMLSDDIEKGMDIKNTQRTEPFVLVQILPYAVFKGDKLIGWLDEYTSKGVNFLLDEVKSTMIAVQCDGPDRNVVMEYVRGNTKITAKVKKNQPKFNVDLEVTGILCQVDCDIDITHQKGLDKLIKQFEEVLKQQIESTISELQTTYQADVVGFGEVLHREDPVYWKKIKKDWPTIFTTVEVDVNVKVIIKSSGSIINPLIKETKGGE